MSNQQIYIINDILNNGGTCILPTETVYGIFASSKNKEGLEKIFEIKKRDKKKSIALLFHSSGNALQYLFKEKKLSNEDFIKKNTDVIQSIMDTGTTVVFFKDNGESTGVRIPQNKIMQDLLSYHGSPVFGTSVNIAGEPAAIKFKDISPEILNSVNISAGLDEDVKGVPSTVIYIKENSITIKRYGLIGEEDLKKYTDKIIL